MKAELLRDVAEWNDFDLGCVADEMHAFLLAIFDCITGASCSSDFQCYDDTIPTLSENGHRIVKLLAAVNTEMRARKCKTA